MLSRMVSGGPLGVLSMEGPWTAPGTPPGPPGSDPDPFWTSGKELKKKRSAQGAQKFQFLGPGQDPKIDPWSKKASQEALF